MSETKQLTGYAHAYQRLIELGPDRMATLEGRMAKAEPTGQLADLIQKDWGFCKDVDRRTLMRQISRYRNQVITPKMAVLYEAGQGGTEAKNAVKILYNQVDVIDGMHDLLELQLQRIQKAVNNEAKLPVLLKDVSSEIDLARKIYSDLGSLQLETGTLRKARKGVQGEVTNPDGTKSSFAYVVGESEAPILGKEMQSFIDQIDERLGYARKLSADSITTELVSEDNHSS